MTYVETNGAIVLDDNKMKACVDIIHKLNCDKKIKEELKKSLIYLNNNRLDVNYAEKSLSNLVVFRIAFRIMKATDIEEAKQFIVEQYNNNIFNSTK